MDQSLFEMDNTKNCLLESYVPDCARSEACWLGIDEAGRGPVLGPMVYGICYSPISLGEHLNNLGFADSKTLSAQKREEIFSKLDAAKDLVGWMVEILSPTYISNSMLRVEKYNLNTLSHDCAIGLIRQVIDRGVYVREVYVDTVGDPVKYEEKLKSYFPNLDITVAKKADATYPIVSAASICAKVARDQAVEKWNFIEGFEVEENGYGSGYPNDPNTKQFMMASFDKVFGYPQFVRFGWSTASEKIAKHGVPFKWEDDKEKKVKTKKPKLKKEKCASVISPYFTMFTRKEEPVVSKSSDFFRNRSLSSLESL